MKKVFLGSDGRIRLFWRLALFVVLYLFLVWIAQAGIRRSLIKGLGVPLIWGNLVFAVVYIAATLGLTLFFRRRIDRKPWSGMALGTFRNHWRDFLAGLVLAAAMTGSVFFIGEVTGGMRITSIDTPSETVGQAAVFLLATALSNFAIGFTEELAMRGYVFQNSAERMPVWLALLLNGWIFGAMHFSAEDFSILTVLLMPVAIAFLVFARLLTGNLWLAIGWHTCWNFLQYDVFGIWGGGLWHVKISDPDAWGGNHLLVLLLADVVFFLLLRIRRSRIRLRGRLSEDGSPAGNP